MMRQYELVERVQRYNPNCDEGLLNRAYVYAMQKHGTQKRDSGDPYFSHPLEVAAILTDLRVDDATIVIALLHDTIEDTDVTYEDLKQEFGTRVADLVAAVGPPGRSKSIGFWRSLLPARSSVAQRAGRRGNPAEAVGTVDGTPFAKRGHSHYKKCYFQSDLGAGCRGDGCGDRHLYPFGSAAADTSAFKS